MTQLDAFVNNVQTMSGNGHFGHLADYVRKFLPELSKPPLLGSLENALQLFSLERDTMGVLAILYTKLLNESGEFDVTLAQIGEFVSGCQQEQIRLLQDIYCETFHLLTVVLAEKRKEPMRGILVLQQAVAKLITSETQLTTIHSDLCLLCLSARNLKPALKFLDQDINDIMRGTYPNHPFDSKYFLLYYYYGGMVYAAMKNFDRSLFFLEIAITTPCTAISSIMVESYKKYLLVSLIHNGKLSTLPKYTSQLVTRFIKPMCQCYEDLAKQYQGSNVEKLRDFVQKHRDTYDNDHNFGLVKQVIHSLYKRNIQRLTKTFVTLSLADVASRCRLAGGAEEAEKSILAMIEDGEIFASINQKDGMVSFSDRSEVTSTVDLMRMMDDDIQNATGLERHMRSLDEQIMVNPQYVTKLSKNTTAHEDEGLGLTVGIPSSSSKDFGMQLDPI